MNTLNQYRAYQVETSSPEDLIVLLYDGARRFVDQAAAALAARQYEQVTVNTAKAQRILEELTVTLNDDAGEIAANLRQLYDYWMWRLSQGLIKQDPAAFAEVSNYLSDFREVWAEAARKVRAERALSAHG